MSQEQTQKSKTLFWLACMAVYGFRLMYVLDFPDLFFQPDSNSYFLTVQTWDQHDRFLIHFDRTPLYPLFLLLLSKWGACLSWITLIQQVSQAFCIMGFGFILGRVLSSRIGWIAAAAFVLAAGFAPSQVDFASQLMTEGLQFQVFFLATLAFFWWMKKKNLAAIALLAGALALAMLLRPANMAMALAAFLAVAWTARPAMIKNAGALLIATFVFLCPWMLYNRQATGSFALSNMGVVALTHSFGHLLSMDSPENAQYKAVLLDIYEDYTEKRKTMSHEDRLLAGTELLFEPDGYLGRLAFYFQMDMAHVYTVMGDMLKEGLRDHPFQAARIVLDKIIYVYTGLPGKADASFSFNAWNYSQSPLSPKAKRDALAYYPYGLADQTLEQRKLRFRQAGWPLGLELGLMPIYSRTAVFLLWLSIFLFPACLHKPGRGLAMFLFFYLHLSLLMYSATVSPVARFYQPMVPVVFSLLALEISALFYKNPGKQNFHSQTWKHGGELSGSQGDAGRKS